MKVRSVISLCAGSLIALGITAGCDNSKSSSSTTSTQKPTTTTPPANTSAVAPSVTHNPPPPPPATPATTIAKPEDSASLTQSTPATPPATPATPNPSDEEKREQASNLIYAQIRVKMEEFIDERAKLLKEGTDPADPKVRELEGRIMRARELLTQNGEVVEEVEPPIVQKTTTP